MSATDAACWRLDSGQQTLVLASMDGRLPFVAYWGAPLAPGEDLAALVRLQARPIGHGVLDVIAELSVCPEEGRGFQGQPGLRALDEKGHPVLSQFALADVAAEGPVLSVTAHDQRYGLIYRARFEAHAGSGMITAEAALENSGAPLRVLWLSAPVLPVSEAADEMVEFAGRWTQEFGVSRVPLRRGVHVRESRRGRTGQDHFPGLIVPEPGCTDIGGQARGLSFAFSGLHRIEVEVLADGRRQVQAGLPEPALLETGAVLTSGAVHFGFSDGGLNGLMQGFQTHVRGNIVRFPDPARPRPVHYNCWEAVYFDHDLEVLKDLADRAAALGAERFVLDDGWFGRRDDDTTSLGDWAVDPRKYPDGLGPLIAHINGLGMAFGLWVEPEMVNLDSDLARAHPDWIIMPEGRAQLTGRGQHVLDLSRAEVCDYLFDRLDALLRDYPIDYLKWDMNRDLTLAVDAAGAGLLRRQTEGLYALIDRLNAAHPKLEIESCASGGGRIDYGILQRTQRVWLSDSNDAHERWRMQHEAMLFLPPEVVGSHVGPRHCHTSGRMLSMAFRAGTAMTGHMGFEMDLRELSGEEADVLARYTRFYKENRDWLHAGRQVRLGAGTAGLAHMSVAKDADRFLLFAATLAVRAEETNPPLRLAGLDPDARYRVCLWNRDEVTAPPTRIFDSPLLDADGIVLSGRALMQAGLVLPLAFPDTLWIVRGERV